MAQKIQQIQKDHHQIIVRSPAGENPADFTVRLTNAIRLNPNKHYVVGLHNAILTASWNTAPLGVAYTVNTTPVSIPTGHFTFETLKEYIKADFTIETIPYSGRVKITIPTGKTVVLGSLADRLGFTAGVSLTAGNYEGTKTASINTVNFLSVSSNIIDINSTRSNANVRPLLRTALLPSCLGAYDYFDLCSSSDDYYVKCNRNEILTIDIRIEDDAGRTVELDQSIPTYWTLTIKETDLI